MSVVSIRLGWCLGVGIAIGGVNVPSTNYALAQIVPDGTLPNNSIVTPQGNTNLIEGGSQAGGNLFHSFGEFSVPTGSTAFFNNAVDIQNIISRVTGGSVSNIDGLIRASGAANLFLINPNGIIFGRNAELNVGGSFLASTASSLKFADGTQFSATAPQTTPLLTISVPIGLQFGGNSGAIRVQGTGYNPTLEPVYISPFIRDNSVTGLRVQPGKTLALVGGDVTLEGGTLTAKQGRIELGSVSAGLASLIPTAKGWTLGYESVQSFRNIRLSQLASADVSGVGSGSIHLQGSRVILTSGSGILNQNQGGQPAGSLSVNASESVEVSGIYSGLLSETLGVGNGGDILVSTKRLVIQDGGSISTRSFNTASGGKLTVNASESVQVIGFSSLIPSVFSSLYAATFGSGDAGDIIISTGRLIATSGGTITSATFGIGSGGDVTVNATELVNLIGVQPTTLAASVVAASTFNAGNAGKLTINTRRLAVRDGGRVAADTLATGDAGSVTVNASESVEVSGKVPGSRNPSLVTSSANLLDEIVQQSYGQAYGLPSVPSGASGDVTINTPALSVTDGALVNVRNDGPGDAGTLRVNARSIVLDKQGSLTASTVSGEGGNIILQLQDLLLLRNNSQISAIAGGTGNGGNIDIDASFIVAVPTEDSNISANAFAGRGGRVDITATGIFGIQSRSSPTSFSDITASSERGTVGVVEINTRDVDPSRGLVELPANLVDASQQIAQGCTPRGRQTSSFVITGRGGLPLNPREAFNSDTVRVDWVTLNSSSDNRHSQTVITHPTIPTPKSIVEATGWVVNEKGEVILTANPPTAAPHGSWQKPALCSAIQSNK